MIEQTKDCASLELPSVLDSIEVVEQTAEAMAQRGGFDEDTVGHIALACREAAVNAIVHGNQQDPGKKVSAQFELAEGTFTIRIADRGAGFDPEQIADPLAAENLLRTSGRGVFLLRALMDEVHFRQLSPGTEITLIKHRT